MSTDGVAKSALEQGRPLPPAYQRPTLTMAPSSSSSGSSSSASLSSSSSSEDDDSISAAPPPIAKPIAQPLAFANPAAKPTSGNASSASSSSSFEDDDSTSAAPPAVAKPAAKPNAFEILMAKPTNGKASTTSSSPSSEDDDSTSAAPPAVAKPSAKPNGGKAKAKPNGGKPPSLWAKPMTMVAKVSAYDKKWLENLDILRPCIREDGAIDYSALPEHEKKHMQSFVKDQRKCYRKRERGEPSPLTEERFRLLREANFDFDPTATSKANSDKKKEKKKKAKPKSKPAKKSPSELPAQLESKLPSGESSPTKTEELTSDSEMSPNKIPVPASDSTSPASDSKLPATKTLEAASGSKTPGSKAPKAASKKSPPSISSARKKSGKLTYLEMVHEAIVSLKDRTGSSVPAISKWVLANFKQVKSVAPNTFKNRIAVSIKQGMKEGRFTKVKNSYKINAEFTKKQKAAHRAKEAKRKKAQQQRQKDLEKVKQQKVKQQKAEAEKKKAETEKAKAEAEKKRSEEEKKRKERELTPEERAELALKKKRKEEAEERRKFVEQQLRKRRYPIEDTRLHRENKEWGVKTPERLIKRPPLPHTLACLVPPHLRTDAPRKHYGAVANASASGSGPLLGGDNERGLVADAIQVYHFFCGDVGVEDEDHPLPKFSLKTLFYALDEVLNGNAREAKSLPPLLTYFFVTALRMLTAPQHMEEEEEESLVELRLQKDLAKLNEGLNAISWSQICFFYMDLMERYYTSDSSLEEGVVPREGREMLDMRYFWNNDRMEVDEIETQQSGRDNGYVYKAYLGDPQGVVMKAYSKLQSQSEPWELKADELMALLRTLTDDILGKNPDLAEDIAGRGEKLNELSKEKRAATIKYNKVKLAFQGPKKPSRPTNSRPTNKAFSSTPKTDPDNESKAENKVDEQADAEPKEESEKPFVPTATEKQFLAAEKAQIKAIEAYERGLEKLISKTDPVAFDRNHNAIYFFRQDPTMLHVEQLKQSSLPPEVRSLGPRIMPHRSWHAIDTKPLFEQFLQSLDKRGQREDELLKSLSGLTIKRRLLDDKKENTRASAREREKEELERRLQNARTACDADDGRRSGRLAGMARGELKNLEAELERMAKLHDEEERQEKLGREKASDYSLLTGLQMVADLFAGQRATRSNRKSQDDAKNEAALLANTPPHKLWMDESVGGNGTLHILAEALSALEEKCNVLSPWTREDMTRKDWRKQLSDASCAWAIDCVMQLGPSTDTSQPDADSSEDQYALGGPNKKPKVEISSGTSLASIIATFKLCLKDLELRVFEISGKKRAIEEADTAARNGASSDEEDDGELNKHWKIKINALRRLPTTRYGLIRDIIVAAITVARKSHLKQVAAELKAALQLLRPSAGGEAKSAAIKVLEKYGGYDGSDDEYEDVDFDELAAAHAGEVNADEEADGAEIASLLCDEVRMINGSVGGDDSADKFDWSDAIKDCKSVSRLALMLQSFLKKADATLTQLKEERDTLDSILGLNAKRTARFKTSIKKHDSSIAIWCNAKLTNKLVKARVNGFPWWPAHVCIPVESIIADALAGSTYSLVSSVGNPGMFLVNEKEMVDFTEEINEDLSEYHESIIAELQESTAIAKKLWRHQNRGVASPWSKKSRPPFIEEKKTAH